MKKILLLVALAVSLMGCIKEAPYWVMEHKAMTPQEQQAVADMEEKMMSNISHLTLSGHDQDWDDTVKAVHHSALEACCPPRMFEKFEYSYTGRWKPVEK